ncbi:MAG: SRPBCC family protein [Methylotetracoccus sp.]
MLWFLATIVLGFVIAIVIGSRLPRTHIAASRIVLQAEPAEVWRLLTDFESYANWRPGLRGVELGPPIEGRPTWYEVCARNVRVQFSVIDAEPLHRLVTQLVGDKLPLSGMWVYELRSVDKGTELTITEQDRIYSPFMRFLTKFVFAYYGIMDVFLIALARALGEDARPEHLSLRLELATKDA